MMIGEICYHRMCAHLDVLFLPGVYLYFNNLLEVCDEAINVTNLVYLWIDMLT
jgi:hypothetical protein